MAKCRWCKRGRLFRSVDTNGLCRGCAPGILLEIDSRTRGILESIEIVSKSKSVGTRMSRCDLIIEYARALAAYEAKDIPTLSPPPSKIAESYEQQRADILFETLRDGLDTATAKADLATTPAGRTFPFSKAILDIQSARNEYSEIDQLDPRLRDLEQQAKRVHHKVQLEAFLKAGKKAEFKGHLREALEQYQEAAFFLRNDTVADHTQRQELSEIEDKVRQLTEQLSKVAGPQTLPWRPFRDLFH